MYVHTYRALNIYTSIYYTSKYIYIIFFRAPGYSVRQRIRQVLLLGRVIYDRNHQLVVIPVPLHALDHLLVRDAERLLPVSLAHERRQHAVDPVAMDHRPRAAQAVRVLEQRRASRNLQPAHRPSTQAKKQKQTKRQPGKARPATPESTGRGRGTHDQTKGVQIQLNKNG